MNRLLCSLVLAASSLATAATLTLTPGQTGRLGDRTVTLLSVQDSRCPINARCIRAGELKATLLVGVGQRVRLLHVQFPAVGGVWPGVRISGASDLEIGKRVPVQVTLSDTRD